MQGWAASGSLSYSQGVASSSVGKWVCRMQSKEEMGKTPSLCDGLDVLATRGLPRFLLGGQDFDGLDGGPVAKLCLRLSSRKLSLGYNPVDFCQDVVKGCLHVGGIQS
uniref:Uncharacterized protein n=1 Tax=Micrurus surinamensis TaxID=129470 RepID=A0A2D4PQY5_MICSU